MPKLFSITAVCKTVAHGYIAADLSVFLVLLQITVLKSRYRPEFTNVNSDIAFKKQMAVENCTDEMKYVGAFF